MSAIYAYPQGARQKLRSLFPFESTLVNACLEGAMGKVWGDHPEKPGGVVAQIGDFLFLGGSCGDPCLLKPIRQPGKEWIVVGDEAWRRQMACMPGTIRQDTRWQMETPQAFDRMKLNEMTQGTNLRPIDGEIYDWCINQPWCRDWVSLFDSREDYLARGLGFAAVVEGTIAAGASSYAVCDGAVEIQVDTREDYRRRGLARAASAQLILECLERGLTPTWDAANPASRILAESLGYRVKRPYKVVLWTDKVS